MTWNSAECLRHCHVCLLNFQQCTWVHAPSITVPCRDDHRKRGNRQCFLLHIAITPWSHAECPRLTRSRAAEQCQMWLVKWTTRWRTWSCSSLSHPFGKASASNKHRQVQQSIGILDAIATKPRAVNWILLSTLDVLTQRKADIHVPSITALCVEDHRKCLVRQCWLLHIIITSYGLLECRW